jgi:glycosyltransferase involved in cell wall biosynthesis
MPDIYRSSDIVVVPSRWDEPFGLILIEAAMAGKPVVATRAGGMPEVIEDGKTGFLAEREDDEMIAAHIRRLVDDDVLRRSIAHAAREHVSAEFTSKPVLALENLYISLLADE